MFTVPDKAAGDVFTEAMWDTYIRDALNLGVVRLLGESVLTAVTGSVTFASIPATFRSLMIVASARSNVALTIPGLYARINGDTAANYDGQEIYGNGATIAAAEVIAGTAMQIGHCTGASVTAAQWGITRALFPNYADGLVERACESSSFAQWIRAAAGQRLSTFGSQWRSTAAISSILLYPGGGSFIAESRFQLYGLPS